jgi:hypothetical protein
MNEQQTDRPREEFHVSGTGFMDKVKELIHEGNVRRIIVKHEDKVVLELPLTIGAVGFIVAPVWAALGAFAALVADCTIEVEREEQPQSQDQPVPTNDV